MNIGEVIRYAIITARAQADPAAALKGALVAPKVTHRAALTDPVVLGSFLRALDAFDGQPGIPIKKEDVVWVPPSSL
jgi:hypothetical protein